MSKSVPFALDKIMQISIRVKDVSRAVEFYRDVLGIQFLFEAPPQMAFFQCGSVRLLLGVPEKSEFDHPCSILYFQVPDIDLAYQTLVERGTHFEAKPHLVHKDAHHELWIGFFRDPDQNMLAIASAKML